MQEIHNYDLDTYGSKMNNASLSAKFQKYSFYIMAAAVYIVLALIVIQVYPTNIHRSDVPIDIHQAEVYLSHGQNPYGQNYTVNMANPYSSNRNNIEVVQFLQYPPMMVLYYFPSYLLGDVRYGNLIADMVIYCLIVAYFRDRSFERKFAFLYLGNGLNFIVNYYYGGNDIVAGLFVAISIYLLNKKEKLSATTYGLSLITKQLSLLVLPYFLFKAKKKVAYLLLSATSSLLISLPFFPQVFYDVVLKIFYGRIPLVSYLLIFYPMIFMPLVGRYAQHLARPPRPKVDVS